MWPILILAIVGLAVVIERFRSLKMLDSDDDSLRQKVIDLLSDDKPEEALETLREFARARGRGLANGLRKYLVLKNWVMTKAKSRSKWSRAWRVTACTSCRLWRGICLFWRLFQRGSDAWFPRDGGRDDSILRRHCGEDGRGEYRRGGCLRYLGGPLHHRLRADCRNSRLPVFQLLQQRNQQFRAQGRVDGGRIDRGGDHTSYARPDGGTNRRQEKAGQWVIFQEDGGMKLRRNKLLAEPPAGASSDIAFILIVFFLVCASVQPEQGRPQEIPKTEGRTGQAGREQEPRSRAYPYGRHSQWRSLEGQILRAPVEFPACRQAEPG